MKLVDKQPFHLTGKISFSRCNIYGLNNHEKKGYWSIQYRKTYRQKNHCQIVTHVSGLLKKYNDYAVLHSKFVELYGAYNLPILYDEIALEPVYEYNYNGKTHLYRKNLSDGRSRTFLKHEHYVLQNDNTLVFHKGIRDSPIVFKSSDYVSGFTLCNDIYDNNEALQKERALTYLNKRRKIKERPDLFINANQAITINEYVKKHIRTVRTLGGVTVKDYEEITDVRNYKSHATSRRDKKVQTEYTIEDKRWKKIAATGFELEFDSPSNELYVRLKKQRFKDSKRERKEYLAGCKAKRDAMPIRTLTEDELAQTNVLPTYFYPDKEPVNASIHRKKHLKMKIENAELFPRGNRSFRKKSIKRLWRIQNKLTDFNYY